MPIELQTNLALIPEPAAPSHVVNVRWVTDFVAGLRKAPVRLVATVNQTGSFDATDLEFTYGAQGPIDIDGEEIEEDDRELFTGQSDHIENLVYTCTHKGVAGTDETVLTVAADFKTDIQPGMTVSVTEGDDHADTNWKLVTSGTITLDSTNLEFIPVTPPTGAKKYAETITGDGATTDFPIQHNLGDTDVSVTIFNLATKSIVLADVHTVDNNEVEIGFAEPPTAAQGPYRVVVIA